MLLDRIPNSQGNACESKCETRNSDGCTGCSIDRSLVRCWAGLIVRFVFGANSPTSAEVKRGWRRRAGTNSAIRFSLFIGEKTKKIENQVILKKKNSIATRTAREKKKKKKVKNVRRIIKDSS